MYRTDKQFLNEPSTAPCRIYVGGLAKTVINDDLEQLFSKYGKITGLSINKCGFGFIQFEHETEAKAAIQGENGATLHSKTLMVKQAHVVNDNRVKGGIPLNQRPPLNQPLGPPKHGDRDFPEDKMDEDRPNIRPMQNQPLRGGRKGGRGGGPGGPNRPPNERFTFEPPFVDNYNRDPFYNRNEPPYGGPPPMIEPPPAVEKNDCEIIVVSKALTEYAEFIEQKLKNLGLLVDLLFPNEDVPIGKVLANISSRGCLYAILVMPINEENRSLTLNILHGIPQEHRNMPVEDAMILISRNFESYMKGEHVPPEVAGVVADRHPLQMQMLLNLLAENRQLTSLQYDRLIKYLQDRRELQREFELAEGIAPDSQDGLIGASSDPKQAELQNRIMSILNNKPDGDIPVSITASETSMGSAEPTPILKDPTVQKALDSLMLGDMFKNMADG